MKSLYLVRHAESSGHDANVRDYDRPLNEHGEEDAHRLGKCLRRWPKPEVIISSPAMRAKTTSKILATEIGYPTANIIFDERIYEAELKDLMLVIRDVNNTVVSAMLVGHNPALTQLVNDLGQCDIANMPTCSMAVLQFPSDSWDDIGRVKAELLDFDYPKKEAERGFE